MTDKRYKWLPHHIEFIKKHQADMTRLELCELMKKSFNDLPENISRNTVQLLINRRLKLKAGNDGKFKKGKKPWNDGLEGYSTSRRAKVGDERVSHNGYALIKTSNDRHGWKMKHVIKWESINGEIPEGYCLKFLDGDKLNCDISNLMLIPKPVLTRVNRDNPADTKDPELNKAIILTETLKHEIRKLHG